MNGGGLGDRVGPHDLVISYGDCEFHGSCVCGAFFGSLRPDQSFNEFGEPWERHVMANHRDCKCEGCQL